MLILRGASALSPFRRDKLTQRLSIIDPAIRLEHCAFVHFAQTTGEVSGGRKALLGELLGEPAAGPDDTQGELFLVVPRPGTISPGRARPRILHTTVALLRCGAWSAVLYGTCLYPTAYRLKATHRFWHCCTIA